jgi:hypothetical protein
MYKYKLWIRISDFETRFAYVFADSDLDARELGQAQFGQGTVLSWERL